MKKSNLIIFALIITVCICSFSFAGIGEKSLLNSKKSNSASDQPYASCWYPSGLLNWSPSSDADASFNKSNTPLRKRFTNQGVNYNSNARADEGKVNSLAIFGNTSQNPSQGSLDINYYAFSYWQYIDLLVFWGGSAGEGIIIAPNPGVIDAAHKNGVKVLGTVFFPPTVYGGKFDWVNEFLQKSGNTFPIADKLIEVANYYGFDGWFINQETEGGNAQTAIAMRDFIEYYQSKSNLDIEWYDAMTEAGVINWQGKLNNNNDWYFQNNGKVLSEHMFIDFRWKSISNSLNDSRDYAKNMGRSQYDLYAGVDVQENGYQTSANWSAIFPAGQPHTLSLGLYVPSWTFHKASSVTDFHNRERQFWVGKSGDPSLTSGNGAWKGLAHYIAPKSAVSTIPFITNFCMGQGYDYYVNGKKLSYPEWSTKGWNNISLQDVMPTWRWIVESAGNKLVPEIDFTDAYYGGNCLKVSGDLSSDNHIKLYQTDLLVASDTKLDVVFKTGKTGASNLKVGISFKESPADFIYLDAGNTTTEGWNSKTIDISSYSGKSIAVISLFFQGGAGTNYEIKIGRIGIYNGSIDIPSAPGNVNIINKNEITENEASLRLSWTHSTGKISHYNIYRKNADNSYTYLGGTPNNYYFVPNVKRENGETEATIEVEAVSDETGHSSRSVVKLKWDSSAEPKPASSPNPPAGLSNITRAIELSWTPSTSAISHDIYFGTTPNPPFIGNQKENTFKPSLLLEPNTVYYWKVDEKNLFGTGAGTVWSFTTSTGSELPSDKTDAKSGIITVRGENGTNEGRTKAFDNDPQSKWLDFSPSSWIQYQFPNSAKYIITRYSITSANDAPGRDPKEWTLKASNDGINWTEIDKRTNEEFTQRFQKKTFTIKNETEYNYYRFDLSCASGGILQIAEIELIDQTGGALTAIGEINQDIPKRFGLNKIFPNPFNPSTKIEYDVPKESDIKIEVFDIKGQHVSTLLDSHTSPGKYELVWKADSISSGVYFVRMKAESFVQTKKCLFLK